MEATRERQECVPAFFCAAPALPSERTASGWLAKFSLGELQALVRSFNVEPSRAWA